VRCSQQETCPGWLPINTEQAFLARRCAPQPSDGPDHPERFGAFPAILARSGVAYLAAHLDSTGREASRDQHPTLRMRAKSPQASHCWSKVGIALTPRTHGVASQQIQLVVYGLSFLLPQSKSQGSHFCGQAQLLGLFRRN
jgi:hypothetical protein